jgi:hypothetical protein
MQRRLTIRNPGDVPALPPVAAGALQLLPPAAYVHQPATSFNIKFAGQAPSKASLRCIYVALRCRGLHNVLHFCQRHRLSMSARFCWAEHADACHATLCCVHLCFASKPNDAACRRAAASTLPPGLPTGGAA